MAKLPVNQMLNAWCVLPGAAGSHAANPNDYVTYAGLTLKKAPTGEYLLSKGIGAIMW